MNKEEKREYMKEYNKLYYLDNKERLLEYQKQYRQTPMGRAQRLAQTYKYEDRKHGRGECTLTAEWIVNNIFTKKCTHCDESDWRKLGCNRLDNSKPHTPDNVEPCCEKHNNELISIERSKQVYQYTLDGELVNVWESTAECGRNGYDQGNVCKCCNGRVETYKGYKWQYAT